MWFFKKEKEKLIDLIQDSIQKKQVEMEEELKRFPQVKKKLSQLNIEGYEAELKREISKFRNSSALLKEIEEILEKIAKQREREEIEELISKTEKLIEGFILQVKGPEFLAALKVILGLECPKILQQFYDEEISYPEAKQGILTLQEQAKILASGDPLVEESHYQILEVSEYASQEEIKRSFQEKIVEYHPDRQPPDSKQWVKERAEQITRKLNEAYRVLAEPKKRREYDRKMGIRRNNEKKDS